MMRRLLITCLSLISIAYAQNRKADIFKDASLTTLKKNISEKQIDLIQNPTLKNVATQLYNKNYPLDKRYREYSNYESPQTLAKKLKTSPYSQYENPTGIYFSEGDSAVLWVEKTNATQLSLRVTNWDDEEFKQKDYPLTQGYNAFKIENKGNSYIQYFTPDKAGNNKVKIHILSGKVNGVFDISKHTNKDWDNLLANATAPVLDIVGKQVQLAYAVQSLQTSAAHQGVELVKLYDSIIGIQHELMGLKQTNRIPKNRMFGRVIWKGFMHADGIGAAFHNNTMKDVANVAGLRKNSWGVAHEFGHVNQVRPNMKWVGTTEVTNNIYSVWTQYIYNQNQPKLEREKLKDYDEPKIGGRITSYMESAFIHRQPWLTQAGPDRWDRERPRDWGGDHFVKLVPLWQLQLYFNVAGEGNTWENKNFYGDIFTKAINAPTTKDKPDAYYQLEFIKNACDAAKLDLTDFFEQSGLLIPIDLWVDDYTCAQMTITPNDIQQVKTYAAKYPKPNTPVLHYITANSVQAYKNKLAVSGTKGSGYTKENKKIIVDNSKWKNAVAFETFAGDKLVKIAFVGAGSADATQTIVHIPEGATAVKAVSWDGKRIDIL